MNTTIDYQYNILNQLVSRTDENDSVTFSYDKRGNRVAEVGKEETMPKPVVNANYFYRMRSSSSVLSGVRNASGNLVVGSYNGSKNDLWQLYGNKLKNAFSGTYIGGSIPSLVSYSSAPTITFEAGSNADTYYVKASTGKYLNYTSSGNLEWGSSKITAWYFERLIQLVDIGGYSGNNDYFSERCGETTGGDWPVVWTEKVNKLYKALFGASSVISLNHTYLNLYGAMYNSSTYPPSYRGKFHTGIDLNNAPDCEVYAPIGGLILAVDKTWGTVCIQKNDKYNFTMSHLRSIPTVIKAGVIVKQGDLIGHQGNTGLNLSGNEGTHVHFEVTSSTNLCLQLPSLSSEAIDQTVVPYSYI